MKRVFIISITAYIIILALIMCSKQNPVEINKSEDLKSATQKSDFMAAMNTNNPYDIIGKLHNEGLDDVYNNLKKRIKGRKVKKFEDIENELNSSIQEYSVSTIGFSDDKTFVKVKALVNRINGQRKILGKSSDFTKTLVDDIAQNNSINE